ncbi:hypothetical protein IFO70_16975 [Phormidium tenue FACHB-886]|nr:hypothetical protein [Phormidium tenue FACHB-886]
MVDSFEKFSVSNLDGSRAETPETYRESALAAIVTPPTTPMLLSGDSRFTMARLNQAILCFRSSPNLYPDRLLEQPYLSLNELTPWLLWRMARSACGTMQLLEGTTAKLQQAEQPWQTGILRLVLLLEIDLPGANSFKFDLVTQQTPTLLENDCYIQCDAFSQKAVSIVAAKAKLVKPLQTDALQLFLQGMAAEVLIPHLPWQPALLRLRLGFEYTPDSSVLHLSVSDASLLLRVTDSAWSNRYREAIDHQHLTERLPDLLLLRDAVSPAELAAVAWEANDRLQGLLASRNMIQSPLPLADLVNRLFWGFSHSAYEVMQLMSGVSVHLLQPGQSWESGILRLWLRLEVQTPEAVWEIDLATGQATEAEPVQLASTSVVRSIDLVWLHQPMLLESLEMSLSRQIREAAPELVLWAEGTAVELQIAADVWQPGFVHLKIGFELIC